MPQEPNHALPSAFLPDLPTVLREEIHSRTGHRQFRAGELVFSRRTPSDGIYFILQGCLRVGRVSQEGRETVLDFFGPGDWVGEVSTLGGFVRTHDAQAVDNCLLLHLSKADTEELLLVHEPFARYMLQLEAKRLQILLDAIEAYSIQTLEQRLATRLLMLAKRHGIVCRNGVKIRLQLPQETLARLIGATRQRVNQIIKEWEARGLIQQQYGRIVLLDMARLHAMARI